MRSSAVRCAVLSLLLLCAGAQPSAASPLVGLALELFEQGHVHAVSMVEEGGHRHMVLTHVEEGAPRGGDAAHHGHGTPAFCASDHVFHVVAGDAPVAKARGGELASLAPLSAFAAPSRRLPAAPRPSDFPVGATAPKRIVLRL